MTGQIILYAILAFPLILGLVFRVSTSHLFFSLMAGELLARYFGHNIDKIAEQNMAQTSWPLGELALIIAPMVITAVILRGTIAKNRILLHVVPLAITGIILSAFILPIFPDNLQSQISTGRVGAYLLDLNRIIIGGVVVLQLISLWLFSKMGKKHGKHGE